MVGRAAPDLVPVLEQVVVWPRKAFGKSYAAAPELERKQAEHAGHAHA